MEKKEKKEYTEGTEGEKHYIQAAAKKQQGFHNQWKIVLLHGLAMRKLDMIFEHKLLEINFSFGKETANLELPKS